MTSWRSPAGVRILRLGAGQQHHFFGYYNKTPWDVSGSRLLAHQVPFRDARLTPTLQCEIGYFNLHGDGRFDAVDVTTAWNWQMGSQLQWLAGGADGRVLYNVRTNDRSVRYRCLGAAIVDLGTGRRRDLPMPAYVVAPDARYAICLDYRRLYVTHETIGYSGEDHGPLTLAPHDDGLWRMDLASGDTTMILSYRDLRNFHPRASMERAIHWVSHVEVNPSSSRLLFLHRWTERVKDETCFLHRLITVNPDGSDMRLLECSDHPLPQLAREFDPTAVGTFDYEKSEYQISHPMWKDDETIVVWGPHAGRIHYHLYRDADDGVVNVLGDGILVENGHMSFSPTNPRWLLSDTYPDSITHERILFLFDVSSGRRHTLGSFYADPSLSKENRCDLHPRWSPDGAAVCIDSVHEGTRSMYVIDVSSVIQSAIHTEAAVTE